ncbi:MAG TPA: DUF4230 domain-containing protein [Microcoleaceae cyanobacterium]|jgi:hypothetical protein
MIDQNPEQRVKGNRIRDLTLIVLGGVVLAGSLLTYEVLKTGDRWLGGLTSWFSISQAAPKVDVASLVVQQVRDASELTTAVFTMQAVVPSEQEVSFSALSFKTRLLYIAQGEVQAGVDLSQLTAANVQVEGDRLAIQLPAPRLLDSKIDVNRSKVYDYDRGWLGLGPDVGPDLQSRAQKEALKQITQAACQGGILSQASDRAKLVVSQLLNTAGYKEVTVTIQPATVENCTQETLAYHP